MSRERARTSPPRVERLEPRHLLTLSAPSLYTVGTTNDNFVPNAAPQNVITADINGDGKLDLIVSHTSDNSVYVFLGKGDGTFQAPIRTAVGEAIEGDVFAGDFNGDGKLDLFLPSAASGNPAIVLLGNGDGTFKPRIDSSSFDVPGTYPRGWTVGDFNGDGKLDIAATLPSTSDNSGRYIVLLGNGDGTFKSGIVGPSVLGYARWVTAGDFNGDGKLDLAVADGQQVNGSSGNAELTILLGNGDGTFTLGGHYASPGTPGSDTLNPEDVMVADLTGNGKLDVIVSDYDANINVFMGNGDGTFQKAVGYNPGEYPRDVQVADVNGDGKLDLIVTGVGVGQGGAEFATDGYQPGSVSVMLGNGDGTFQKPIQYFPFDYPGWTAVGDFNGDGRPDLATTQAFDGHSLAVMLNDPSSANLPPTLLSGPTASSEVVTGKYVNLSVQATDDGGEANLKYTWGTVVSPPSAVTFSANGTNAAKNTTVNFTATGTYYFKVTVTDAGGQSAIGMVQVTVSSLTGVSIGGPSPASSPAIANQAGGEQEVAAIGPNGNLWVRFQSPSGTATSWSNVGGACVSIAATTNGAGLVDVFASFTNGTVGEYRHTASGFSWVNLGGSATGPIAAATESGGAEQVCSVGSDGGLWLRWVDYLGNSTGWSDVGGACKSVAATRNGAGLVDAFAVFTDGTLHEFAHHSAPSFAWVSLGGSLAGPIAAGLESGGAEQVAAVGTDGGLWLRWVDWLGNSTGWADVGGGVQTVAVAPNAAGLVDVFVVLSDGSVSEYAHNSPSSFSWVNGLATGMANATAGTYADGREEILAVSTGAALWLRTQPAPGAF